MTSDLALTVAVSDYDHVRDLTSHRVETPGLALTFLQMPIPELFGRFAAYREWEVSEFGLGKYVALRSRGDDSLTAIPVFPSRIFRHAAIYVPADSDSHGLADLKGLRVGIPEWAQTAVTYVRGMLTHSAGVGLESIDWIQAGVNEPGRREKVAIRLPEGVRCTPRPDKSLDGMLLAREVDAVISAQPPASFVAGDPRVRRLLRDPLAAEAAYWEETRIFPIMHVIAIRADVLQAHPWVAANLLSAFEEAKKRSVARVLDTTLSRFPVPSIALRAEQAREHYGQDFWPYGLEANRTTLEAFARFAFEQGVAGRLMPIEELFAETTHRLFQA
jgi:4,5-dihydroxyphthalate decarboxylase